MTALAGPYDPDDPETRGIAHGSGTTLTFADAHAFQQDHPREAAELARWFDRALGKPPASSQQYALALGEGFVELVHFDETTTRHYVATLPPCWPAGYSAPSHLRPLHERPSP